MAKEEMGKDTLVLDECYGPDGFVLPFKTAKGLVNFVPFSYQAKDARGNTSIEKCMFKRFVFTTTVPVHEWFDDPRREWARRVREYAVVYEFTGVRQAVRRVHADWFGHAAPPPLPPWCTESITYGTAGEQ